jgi:regulatory protein YycH of two-component signal transduction system YycFG
MMTYEMIKPWLLTIFLILVILYLIHAYWSCQMSYKHVCSATKSDTHQTMDTTNDSKLTVSGNFTGI